MFKKSVAIVGIAVAALFASACGDNDPSYDSTYSSMERIFDSMDPILQDATCSEAYSKGYKETAEELSEGEDPEKWSAKAVEDFLGDFCD